MNRAIETWIEREEYSHGSVDRRDIARKLASSYSIYGDMLLLSPRAFESEAWQWLRQQQRQVSQDETNTRINEKDPLNLASLCELLAQHMKISHIATVHPIPLTNQDSNQTANILRSPTNFTPLYGDFGPETCFSSQQGSPCPTAEDFEAAYWVTAKQNGILQTWAPRWTMFSRGNIAEKARLLTLPSVALAVDEGCNSRSGTEIADREGKGCAAVDLYAGIGYFAFSYLKAGVDVVLGWEINPWSIEGLKRGAEANRWSTALVTDKEDERGVLDMVNGDRTGGPMQTEKKMVVFAESNEFAAARVENLRTSLPPIQHVNCGLLPTSRGSWETALRVLDPGLEGWVHVHENFAVAEIDERSEEVRKTFEQLCESGRARTVRLSFVHQLKSYAPGVMHCVLDIDIKPTDFT